MAETEELQSGRRYRFGVFEVDEAAGELRRQGLRVKLHAQPFAVLLMLLERPGEVLTREEISKQLWPDGTFVDYEHGVNSAVNRLREALGDKASNPRFVETLARRGYRFVAPVEKVGKIAGEPAAVIPAEPLPPASSVQEEPGFLTGVLATPADLPKSSHKTVQTLFVLLQVMYVGFYVGALANLTEINELMSPLRHAGLIFELTILTAALLIPVRAYLVSSALFHPPGAREKLLKLWWFLLAADLLWSLAPFLLLHHINLGAALACTTLLVYAPFAERSLVLMGATEPGPAAEDPGPRV